MNKNEQKIQKEEQERIKAFRAKIRISDNLSITDKPRYEHGKWAYEMGHDCPTCRQMNA